ncbi:hypothetical protein [Paenibacillus odorifer]|uniref:hypothetical protein n=1 Tax=Paenibacillus odorifer TaxID=189426 RepID=UPI00096C7AA3|nr:hypothetical protein [Paenibacillus odorifer]OME41442.1 hypothetical protein BSK58_15030 [Paenibacillus odorifer]
MSIEIGDEIKDLSSNLWLNGYTEYSLKNDDIEMLYIHLLPKFNNLLYVTLDDWRAFFISNAHGKNKIIKLIESTIYYNKRAIIYMNGLPISQSDKNISEIKRLENLKNMIEKHKF